MKLMIAFSLGVAFTACDVDPDQNSPVNDMADSLLSVDTWQEIHDRCVAPATDEPILFIDNFNWGYSMETMNEHFDAIYASGKRLAERAFAEPNTNTIVIAFPSSRGGNISISPDFVATITNHIENALVSNFADRVFFPDMGHSHIFIPQSSWDSYYRSFSVSRQSSLYQELFDDSETKFLYHAAELLDTGNGNIADSDLRFRFLNRNIVGDNVDGNLEIISDSASLANTAHDLPGHKYYGAGFQISASKHGCFPYNRDGETFYFDISLKDIPVDPNNGEAPL